jgi:hypothetical protein
MPYLQISTNVSKSKITEKVTEIFTDVISQSLNKPKGYCAVHILAG